MTSSPVGSTAFFVLALLVICLLVLLLLRYYLPLRLTPAYVLVPVFLAIALPASIVLLVPIDLASSAGTDTDGNRGIWLSDRVVYKSWRVAYWLTFVLSWIILPYLGEYCDSGYREPKARLLYSIRSNAQYQLIMLGSAILGAVYILFQNGFKLDSFQSLAMALAYAWGLILAIYLMGHGLVAFPRTLYRNASVSGRLKRLQGKVPKVNDKLTEALDKLDQYEYQVVQLKQRKNGTARDFQEWIDELDELNSLSENRAGTVARTTTTTVPPVITDRYLADLTRKLKRARHAKMRFSDEWEHLIRNAVQTQAILDSKASQRLEFNNLPFATPRKGFMSKLTLLTPYTRYHVHAYIIPGLYYIASLVTALASISIVWSECINPLAPKLSLIGVTVVHGQFSSGRGQVGFGGQVLAAMWLCYMCLCAFFSLTEVKVWGNRALVRRGTYQESATWYALQASKLTVPLAYNFVTFTPKMIYQDTSFHKFLGRLIKLTDLGDYFSDYFPMFILVPVLASMFGLYGKAKKLCGFADLLEDDEEDEGSAYGTGSWREGRALIDREVQGARDNTLGLSQRSGLISPPSERYRDEQPVPIARTGGPSAGRERQARPERPRPPVDEEISGNFFTDFADRVKNTFETSDFTFTRPKWMGGDDESSSSRGNASEEERPWTRIFGGGNEGRVRL